MVEDAKKLLDLVKKTQHLTPRQEQETLSVIKEMLPQMNKLIAAHNARDKAGDALLDIHRETALKILTTTDGLKMLPGKYFGYTKVSYDSPVFAPTDNYPDQMRHQVSRQLGALYRKNNHDKEAERYSDLFRGLSHQDQEQMINDIACYIDDNPKAVVRTHEEIARTPELHKNQQKAFDRIDNALATLTSAEAAAMKKLHISNADHSNIKDVINAFMVPYNDLVAADPQLRKSIEAMHKTGITLSGEAAVLPHKPVEKTGHKK